MLSAALAAAVATATLPLDPLARASSPRSRATATLPLDPLARASTPRSRNTCLGPQCHALLQTSCGSVNGTLTDGVARFAAIPYARPPERFVPPEPCEPWAGVRDGREFGARCVQFAGCGPGQTCAEDCLFLNVYAAARRVAGDAGEELVPVMVWIHGGGFQVGASNDYDATPLVSYLNGSVAVVTINYRLNVFGFLGANALRRFAPASNSTGNLGLLDQREALRWVRANARRFGGDPMRVTVFGESAGAGSISDHIAMAGSRGLFHRAIIQSSAFFSCAAAPMPHKERIYREVLSATGCEHADCLASLPAKALVAAIGAIPSGSCCDDLPGSAFVTWSPTIDGVEMLEHPLKLVEASGAHDGAPSALPNLVPMLHGTNRDEGAAFETLPTEVNTSVLLDAWGAAYATTMGKDFPTVNRLTRLYLGGGGGGANASRSPQARRIPQRSSTSRTSAAWWAAESSLGDQVFKCSARMTSARLANHTQVFQYSFAPSTMEIVPHGADVEYVFLAPSLSGEALTLAQQMAQMWASFAIGGTPAPPHVWPACRADVPGGDVYLRLNVPSFGGLSLGGGFRQAECDGFFDRWTDIVLGSARTSTSSQHMGQRYV
jgi:para-nitrobenzyl esterase